PAGSLEAWLEGAGREPAIEMTDEPEQLVESLTHGDREAPRIRSALTSTVARERGRDAGVGEDQLDRPSQLDRVGILKAWSATQNGAQHGPRRIADDQARPRVATGPRQADQRKP